MKKTLVLILSVVAVLTLTACTKIDDEIVEKYTFESSEIVTAVTLAGQSNALTKVITKEDFTNDGLLIGNMQISQSGKLIWEESVYKEPPLGEEPQYNVLNGRVEIDGEVLTISGIKGWNDLDGMIDGIDLEEINIQTGLSFTKEDLKNNSTLTSSATIVDGKITLIQVYTLDISIPIFGKLVMKIDITDIYLKEVEPSIAA